MAKALVVFGSTTGNTESVAQVIAKTLAESKIDVTLKNVIAVSKNDFNGDYGVIVLGSSTWGDDEIELQEDFAEFYESMDELDMSGKKAAVFGCGDKTYEHFCGAVDALEEKCQSLGATLVVGGLKIDGDPDDAREEIIDWAGSVASSI